MTAPLDPWRVEAAARALAADRSLNSVILRGWREGVEWHTVAEAVLRAAGVAELVEALSMTSTREANDGLCWCWAKPPTGHSPHCQMIRAALTEPKA